MSLGRRGEGNNGKTAVEIEGRLIRVFLRSRRPFELQSGRTDDLPYYNAAGTASSAASPVYSARSRTSFETLCSKPPGRLR